MTEERRAYLIPIRQGDPIPLRPAEPAPVILSAEQARRLARTLAACSVWLRFCIGEAREQQGPTVVVDHLSGLAAECAAALPLLRRNHG